MAGGFPSPNDELFDPVETRGTPLFEAVAKLAEDCGRDFNGLAACTMGEISRLADEQYGEQLPEFWRIWNDWNQPGPEQPMGDL